MMDDVDGARAKNEVSLAKPLHKYGSCQETGNEKGLVRLRSARSIARPRAAPSVLGEKPPSQEREW